MKTTRLPLRARAAALLIASLVTLTAALASLAACSRTSKSLTPDVSGPVTWTNTVSHLFADRSEGTTPTGCTSCHHAGTAIPDWTSYDTVAGDAATIRGRLANPSDTMRGFLKPGEPEVVIAWIDAGYPK